MDFHDKKEKTTKILLIVLCGIIATAIFAMGVVFVAGLPGLILYFGIMMEEAPPKPEITYGEFPFEVTYEIDGETITVKDIYVCEYDGIGANATGKYRLWKGYIKSTGEEDLVLLTDGNLKLVCALGWPSYYMGDSYLSGEEFTPYIYYEIYPNEFGGTSSGVMDIEPILEKYKIKLISWELSEPIENSFGEE